MIRVGRIQLYVIGLITMTFVSLGSEFIHFWVGDAFNESYVVAALLIAMGLITLPQEIANIHLVTTNQVRYRAYGMLISASIALILSAFLSGPFGATGAALSLMIGYLSGNALFMNYIYLKVLKLDVIRFFKECHVKLMPGLLVVLTVGMILQRFFPSMTIWDFSAKAFLLIMVYSVYMWLFTVDQFEKDLIQSVLPSMRFRKG